MLSIRNLTKGERLRTFRRRRDETQAAAARRLGMPLRSYKLAETDQTPDCWTVPTPALVKLRDNETCQLLRTRRGLTLDDLAGHTGLSKWWLCLIEQGKAPVRRLLDYWKAATRR